MYTVSITYPSIDRIPRHQAPSIKIAKNIGDEKLGNEFLNHVIIVVVDEDGEIVARRRLSDDEWQSED